MELILLCAATGLTVASLTLLVLLYIRIHKMRKWEILRETTWEAAIDDLQAAVITSKQHIARRDTFGSDPRRERLLEARRARMEKELAP